MALKSAKPGEVKQAAKTDELNSYDPQMIEEHQIPSNLCLLEFLPVKVDHLLMAPPAVIADQRRKPQQYESLAQPFKKDRRFVHKFNAESQTWS